MLLISGTYERRKKACHCLIDDSVSGFHRIERLKSLAGLKEKNKG